MDANEKKREESSDVARPEQRETREATPPAKDQDGSLKVHGDKLEPLIPAEIEETD
jgi:hypothetical protein